MKTTGLKVPVMKALVLGKVSLEDVLAPPDVPGIDSYGDRCHWASWLPVLLQQCKAALYLAGHPCGPEPSQAQGFGKAHPLSQL